MDDLAGMIFAKSCNLDSSAVLEIEIVIVPVFLKAPGKKRPNTYKHKTLDLKLSSKIQLAISTAKIESFF